MRKNRSALLVFAVIAIFLTVTLAATKSCNRFEANGLVNISVNDSEENKAKEIEIDSVSSSNDIEINLSTDGEPADPFIQMDDAQNDNVVETNGGSLKTEDNPVLDFFNTLATSISSKSSGQESDQISITIEEDENVDEDVSHEITIDVEDFPIVNSGNAAVLIYHTHTRESYRPEFEGQYVPCGNFRTDDQQFSVCAVGEKLANLLANQYGFSVLHDTTMNEAKPFTKSYDKSLVTMKNDIAQNPNLGIFIDVHRDSLGDKPAAIEKAKNDIVSSGGKEYAKVMFVVGRGDGLTGDEAPDWQTNYALAKAVTDEINKIMPGLAREPMVKAKRYNQHLSNKSMLLEVGYDANTITQAENSVDIVAQAMAAVLGK